MALIQKQFSVNYEVLGGFCRITKAGEMVTQQGEKVKFGNCVRVITTNIMEGDIDPETGVASTSQQIFALKILCETPLQAGQIVNALNPKLQKGEPIYFVGGIPARKNDGSFEATVEMPSLKSSK